MFKKITNKINKITEEYKTSELCKNISCYKEKWNEHIEVLAKEVHKSGISANVITIFGFVVGMMAVNFLAMNMYFEALVCILINRFCDILDGGVAKIAGITNFGIFLDACLDFIFYAGVIFGFALANPYDNAVAASFFLFGYCASVAAMLAYGVVTKTSDIRNLVINDMPFYLGGVTQGFEILFAFVLLCFMPFVFLPVAIALGCWSLVKALIIVSSAYYKLVVLQKSKK